jgi:hypothetical protein
MLYLKLNIYEGVEKMVNEMIQSSIMIILKKTWVIIKEYFIVILQFNHILMKSSDLSVSRKQNQYNYDYFGLNTDSPDV